MKQLADGVFLLGGRPPYAINVYLLADVPIDAATRQARGASCARSATVLIVGDVLSNINLLTGLPGLHEPPALFTPDPARNRESARRLAALEPSLACYGHGAPLRDPHGLAMFVARLKD